ncbi:phosphatidylinositol-specific phospholipase C domain-containing protein, partial [Streptomyces misionensis]|uniref:phosphatidylinositol-specific phospholipase C domain-containing protein n=1 Tax=Streptomyces misionensis TaxID=67331 RepID=UPI0036D0E415
MSPYTATRRNFLAGALAATATVFIGTGSAGADGRRALTTQDWMAAVPDGTELRALTIPGSHDSGARYGGPWTECQNTTIAEQLNSGIRFLDVRCRVTGGSFAIHHGASYQNMMFGDVLVACRDFLAAHPTETVLMRVKQEYSEESDATFRAVFDDYLDNRGWRPLFRIDGALPTLG